MKRTTILAALTLCSCAEVQDATDKAGRDAAKSIMPETLAVFFPQVPKALYSSFTDCVVDNARASEVQSMAGDAVVGVDSNTAETVRGILARPEAQTCLKGKVGPALDETLLADAAQ